MRYLKYGAEIIDLLKKNISLGQMTGYFVANLVGLTVILIGVLFYCDSQHDNSDKDKFFSKNYMVISKKVDGVGFAPVTFSEGEIADLSNQSWVKKVGRFTASTFAVRGSVSIGGMVIDLVSNFVMDQDDICPFVFFIDEVHRYTKSRYSDREFHGGLTLIAREGRKKGIFLYLTTQNPKDVAPILFGQIGTMLIHRLMLNDEIKTVESHLDDYALKHVRKLNQGEVILTSVNLLHNMFIHVKKSDRTQHNATPQL